jgi:flavin-dependent dehydrogenase
VLFAGDAGGFVNGFTAEGIYYAMVSGELAGAALAMARGASKDLRASANVRAIDKDYTRRWRAEMGAELRDSVRIQRYLFGNHARVTRFVRGGRSPEMAPMIELMLGYMRGEISYSALKRRIVFKFPGTMWRMVQSSRQTRQ